MGLISRVSSRTYSRIFRPTTLLSQLTMTYGALRTSLQRLGGSSGPIKRTYNIRVGRVPGIQTPEMAYKMATIKFDNPKLKAARLWVIYCFGASLGPTISIINHYKQYVI